MSSNLIEITVTVKNIIEVLKNLKINSEFSNNCSYTLSLEIENTKENYEYLVKSEKIINWSIINKKSINDTEIYDYIVQSNLIDINNVNDICKLINSCWTAKVNNPSDEFNIDFFCYKVKPIYESNSFHYNNEFLKLISNFPDFNRVKYVLNELKEKWDQIINYSDLSDVIKLLINNLN